MKKFDGPEWFLRYRQHLLGEPAESEESSEISEPDFPEPVQEAKHEFYLYKSLPSAKCYVYVITDGRFLKIGTASDLQRRLGQLQVGNPIKLRIIGCYAFDNRREAFDYERELHSKYAGFRASGEWFRIPYSGMDDIAAAYRKYCSDGPFRERKPKKEKIKKRAESTQLRLSPESNSEIEEYMTLPEAQGRYQLCRNLLDRVANECGAKLKFGRLVRYDQAKIDAYFGIITNRKD